MKRWYIASTKPRQEEKAAHHLRNQGFETYLPRYYKTRRHARRVEKVLRPLFPGYVFIRLDTSMDRWRPVNGTLGVNHILTNGDKPADVPVGVVEEIQASEDRGGVVTLQRPALKKGDKLRLLQGAFVDCVGILEEMPDDKRVVLLLELLGRQVRVKAPVHAISVVA